MDEKRRGLDFVDQAWPTDFLRQTTNDQGRVDHIEHGDVGTRTTTQRHLDTTATFTIVGRPKQNEQGKYTLSVTLAEAISRATGGQWSADPEEPSEPWVDAHLISPRGKVSVQITKAGAESDFRQAGSTGKVAGSVSPADAAAQVWAAIERKISKTGPQFDPRNQRPSARCSWPQADGGRVPSNLPQRVAPARALRAGLASGLLA